MGRAGLVMVVVLGGTALALRAADAIPGWLAGVPPGVRLCASLDEAEARTGLRLDHARALFADYELLADGIRVTAKPEPAVALAMRWRQDRRIHLTLFHGRGKEIPVALRTPLPSFHEIAVPLEKGRSASLKAEAMPDGSVWQDIEWAVGSDATALRFNGRTVELLRLVKQILEDAP
jgi:hypothetical protein